MQTWSHQPEEWFETAYAYFERQPSPTVLSHTASGPRLNEDPVLPRLVVADSVVWAPLTGANGEPGHAFRLVRQGSVVSTIEAYPSSSSLSRIVVVHCTYSPLARETGNCDQSSILCYDDPEAYISELEDLSKKLVKDKSILYAPVSDLYIGRALERMPVRVLDRSNPLSAQALPTWAAVKSFFCRMRPLIANAINNHNRNEVDRCSARELKEVCTDAWHQV